jgi:hypothetical protein
LRFDRGRTALEHGVQGHGVPECLDDFVVWVSPQCALVEWGEWRTPDVQRIRPEGKEDSERRFASTADPPNSSCGAAQSPLDTITDSIVQLTKAADRGRCHAFDCDPRHPKDRCRLSERRSHDA